MTTGRKVLFVIRVLLWVAFGVVMTVCGISALTWQFWAIWGSTFVLVMAYLANWEEVLE